VQFTLFLKSGGRDACAINVRRVHREGKAAKEAMPERLRRQQDVSKVARPPDLALAVARAGGGWAGHTVSALDVMTNTIFAKQGRMLRGDPARWRRKSFLGCLIHAGSPKRTAARGGAVRSPARGQA